MKPLFLKEIIRKYGMSKKETECKLAKSNFGVDGLS